MMEYEEKRRGLDELECCICNRNIRNVNCFPVYDKERGIICSSCCLLACLYSNNMISEEQFNDLPDYVLKYCKEYAKRMEK